MGAIQDFFSGNWLTIIQLSDATIRMAIPLLLACLAGLFSERAGIFDIGLEGKMLMAAFAAASVSAFFTYNPMGGWALGEVCNARGICRETMVGQNFIPPVWIGLLAGIGAAILLSLLHGLASITFRGNQLISGVAINFLAIGLTVVAAQALFLQAGRTPALTGQCPGEDVEVGLGCPRGNTLTGGRFESLDWPGAIQGVRNIREAGPWSQFYSELVSGHSILVYIALLTVPLAWWTLYRTRFGLRLRAVGENPAAVDTAGISVVRLRFMSVIICGVLCGIAGAYLSTAVQSGFTKDMTANRGFIALAALIFAKWRPWTALGACLLFGFFFALENRFPNIRLAAYWLVPTMVIVGALVAAYAARLERMNVLWVLAGYVVFLLALLQIGFTNTLNLWIIQVEDSTEGQSLMSGALAILGLLAALAALIWCSFKNRFDLFVLGGLAVLLATVGMATWASVYANSEAGVFASLSETVKLPSQFISSLPYILTVVVLAGFVGRAIPPRAGGEPYVKER